MPALDRRPELDPALVWYWSAFVTLSDCRPGGGFGPSPIPLGEIMTLCELYGVDDADERERLVHLVKKMDTAYLRHAAARTK